MPRRKDTEIYSYKLKSGKTKYGFKTYIGTDKETGKAVKVTRQGFATRKEAEQAKIKIKAEGAKKVVKKKQANLNKKTVSEVWDIWFDIYRQDVRGSTSLRTVQDWENHIEPEFGDIYIDSISVSHLQRYANQLAQTIATYHKPLGLLQRLIKYAQLRGWAEKDPFARIVIPKKTTVKSSMPKENFYNLDELKAFLTAAKKQKFKYYVYFLTLASLALRSGEGLALKWEDIDFKKHTIYIHKTVSRNRYRKKTINPVKNGTSRLLYIPDNLYKVLKEYRDMPDLTPSDFLFHYDYAPDYYKEGTSWTWMKTIYNNNPQLKRITPHGLRHTLATILYEGSDRIKPKDVQYLLGHSKPTMALDIYTHITEERKDEINKSINNLNL